jgi:hypothetical protein
MMKRMGHPRDLAALAAAALTLVATAGCSGSGPPDEPDRPPSQEVALRVETVAGADRLDEDTRAEAEAAVGELLSAYVVDAFLGTFPRQEFVRSFESFTSVAARDGAGHIDVLTAASARDATAVRATDLEARLSFLARGGTVHGSTATVHLAFDATMADGSTRPLVLDGRFLLVAEGEGWSIFGYDVALDDGAPVDAELEDDAGDPATEGSS